MFFAFSPLCSENVRFAQLPLLFPCLFAQPFPMRSNVFERRDPVGTEDSETRCIESGALDAGETTCRSSAGNEGMTPYTPSLMVSFVDPGFIPNTLARSYAPARVIRCLAEPPCLFDTPLKPGFRDALAQRPSKWKARFKFFTRSHLRGSWHVFVFFGSVHFYWGSAKNKVFATIPRVEML